LTDTSRSALPPLPGHIRPLPNDDNAALEARYPGLPIDLKHCVTCKGAKTFRWYDGAGRPHSTQAPQTPPVVEYDCPCADQRILHRWLLNGGVTESYQRLGWGDLWYYPEGTKATVDQYLAHADGFIDSGFGLILYGSRGTGKTLLAHLVLKTLISRGYDGYSTSFTQMIDTYARRLDRQGRAQLVQRPGPQRRGAAGGRPRARAQQGRRVGRGERPGGGHSAPGGHAQCRP
jgi:hypothetical protein